MSDRGLIAGVGQPWMRDLAFGSHVVSHLRAAMLGDDVDALDLSFSPITASERIAEGQYTRAVFITARAAGRAGDTLYELAPDAYQLQDADVHAHIGDAVMGCISLSTLLVVCRFRRVLPAHTMVIEAEPRDESWGPDLSAPLQRLVSPAAELALRRARP